MAIITDFKRRTITLTQPVIERTRMSNACFHFMPKDPDSPRAFRYHQGKIRPTVTITSQFIKMMKGRKKFLWEGTMWTVIVKDRGLGGFPEAMTVTKPKELQMGRVKHITTKSCFQGASQSQFFGNPFLKRRAK